MDGALKRKADRFEAAGCRVEIRKSGFLGLGRAVDVGGALLDLSESGLRYVAAEKPALESSRKAVLHLGPTGATFEARIVIRWISVEEGGRVVAGAEFEGLDAGARDLVSTLRAKITTGGAE